MLEQRDKKLQVVTEYVRGNMVPVAEGRKCVDGRYLPYQSRGAIARPGGDAGYVLALLAIDRKKHLGLTPEQCFNAVYKVVAKGNGRFGMHTDHYTDPDGQTHHGLIGCGHLAKAALPRLSKDYEVLSADMERFVEYVRNVAEISPALEMTNLDGNHKESGILIVKSRAYTVSSQNVDSGEMYFVYDEDRDVAFMKLLVSEMGLAGVSFSELKEESNLQLEATLHNLAKGLPIYIVTFEKNRPQVQFSHFVA